jgi:hypothetical protein
MLSEQSGKEISNNPKSGIDPHELMVYQIRQLLDSKGVLKVTTYEKWTSFGFSYDRH